MSRSEVVRSAYERFNRRDFEAVLELCAPDVEFRDLLSDSGTAFGQDAVRQRWKERFSESSVSVIVGDVVELGDVVIAAVRYQAYSPTGQPVGAPVVVSDRFSFRGERILRIEGTALDEVPDEVTDLFQPSAPEPPTPSESSSG